MTVEIWMGGVPVRKIQAKNIQWNFNGMCVMITGENGRVFETSANNILIVHDRKEGESDV